MVMVDHVEFVADAAHGWDWALGEDAFEAFALVGAIFDLAALGVDGAHADRHLRRAKAGNGEAYQFAVEGILIIRFSGQDPARCWRHCVCPTRFVTGR